jgi:hypothetical protein
MPLAPLRRPRPPQVPSAPLVADSYLTDGRRLFRVVSRFADSVGHAFASLEDCLTLEVREYSPGELYEMRLRPVWTRRIVSSDSVRD